MKEESSSDEEKMGGKVNRMRKAKKWTDYAEDTAKKALGLADMAKTMAGAKPKKVNARAVVVKKVMADKGMSMIEASKFVKANGLYKPK
jgi:thermostable 8-oxoguanine DNA glycosylase